MTTKHLGIKAGKTAKKKLLERGLRIEDIEILAAPASGPKWLILFELDKLLIKKIEATEPKKRHFIGSSAGAWRAMCYCLEDSTQALERLHQGYIHQTYSETPFGKEVSAGVRQILETVLGENGTEDILNPNQNYLHVSASRASFSIGENRSLSAKLKFLTPILANSLGRKRLGRHFERHIFSNSENQIFQPDDIKSRFSKITKNNLVDALQASGSIPFAMNPVTIEGAEYWDGGVTDYHWGVDFKVDSGIVLLPHFRDHISPGWFDKYPPFRKAKGKLTENTVMVYTKKAFIEKLPHQRLTDMEDFYEFNGQDEKRFKIWKEASNLGKLLAEDFEKLMQTDSLENHIEDL